MPGRAEVARGSEVDIVLAKVDRVSVASAVFAADKLEVDAFHRFGAVQSRSAMIQACSRV